MNSYENLNKALAIFSYELDLDRDQNLGSLEYSIKNGVIDAEGLKSELKAAIDNEGFDWATLAKNTRLILNPDHYQTEDIIAYVKYLLWDHLFPGTSYDKARLKCLSENIIELVQNYTDNEGWVSYRKIYSILKQNKQYEDLDLYYMYYIFPMVAPKLERKIVFGEPPLSSFLRYKKNQS